MKWKPHRKPHEGSAEISKEWFQGLTCEDSKAERCWLRSKVFWALAVALAVIAFYVAKSHAGTIYLADQEGVQIALTDEKCALAEVKNLRFRATWSERGQTFEGCWAMHQGAGLILAYFADKTVVIFPPQIFTPTRGT